MLPRSNQYHRDQAVAHAKKALTSFRKKDWKLAVKYFGQAVTSQQMIDINQRTDEDWCALMKYHKDLGIAYSSSGDLVKSCDQRARSIEAFTHVKVKSKSDLACARKNYEGLRQIYLENSHEFYLYDFAVQVLSGGKNATHSVFVTTCKILSSSSESNQQGLIHFMDIVNSACTQSDFPDSPFKKYLQNEKNLAAFALQLKQLQKLKQNIVNMTAENPSLLAGVVNRVTDHDVQIGVLKEQIHQLEEQVHGLMEYSLFKRKGSANRVVVGWAKERSDVPTNKI